MASVLNQSFSCDDNTHIPTWKDITKACIICLVMLGIVIGNTFSALVFNNNRGKKIFLKKVRLTMNSLICTDLCVGLLVCPFCVYSALYHCWPFSETFCKFEALFLSALFHESTMSLVIIAVDRYCSVHFYFHYNNFMTSRKYVMFILVTWLLTFCVYSIVIFYREQFYFDEIGINCEPYYENRNITVTVLCLFYICPALLFLFSYGSIFYTANRKKNSMLFAGSRQPNKQTQTAVTQVLKTSKYLAAISMGFFVAITPWSVSTMVIALTHIKLDEDLDFAVTWLAISNSFWNVIIYGLMNRKFRKAAKLTWCSRFFRNSMTSSRRNTFNRSTMSYVSNTDHTTTFSEMTVSQSVTSMAEIHKMAPPTEIIDTPSTGDGGDTRTPSLKQAYSQHTNHTPHTVNSKSRMGMELERTAQLNGNTVRF